MLALTLAKPPAPCYKISFFWSPPLAALGEVVSTDSSEKQAIAHRFSMGLRSGERDSHVNTCAYSSMKNFSVHTAV